MYLIANSNNFRDFMEDCCCFKLEFERPDSNKHMTELQAWMEQKVYKHIGFILGM